MRLLFVSTFPPFECGIATYTKYLADELVKLGHEITVFTEGVEDYSENSLTVRNVYSRRGDFAASILSAVAAMPESPDLIHFQHAPDLFPDNAAFLRLLQSLNDRKIPLLVTLHTVNKDAASLEFYGDLLKYAGVIVHNEVCREFLGNNGKVSVVPHGTYIPEKRADRSMLREKAGFSENDTVFLFAGFIHVQKNLHTVVRAFRRLHSENGSLKMIVAGRPGGNRWYNRLYLEICRMLGGNSGIKWDIAFIENSKLEEYLLISDVVLLPYWQKYASASGIFHLAVGAGRAFICSDSVKFAEIKSLFPDLPLFVPAMSVCKWEESMKFLAENTEMRKKAEQIVSGYADATSWESTARKHEEIYNKISGE